MYAADILFYAAMFGFFGIEPMLALFGLIGGTLELVHKMECGG
jgi:hypothetical protein